MSTSLSDPPCLFASQHKSLIITCNMYVLGVQVCISLILHVQMYSTLVPALKRTSVYFIGTSQIRLVSFCKQHISKSKQKPAQKKDIVFLRSKHMSGQNLLLLLVTTLVIVNFPDKR